MNQQKLGSYLGPQPVTLQGRTVLLRPVMETDYPTLYSWRVDAKFVALWQTPSRRIPTFREYVSELQHWLADTITLLAVDRTTNRVFGFGRAYNLDPVDGWAWVQAYAEQDGRLKPFMIAEAVGLFADYLFTMFPIRCLYSEVFSYNVVAARLNEKLGFATCGHFPEHIWYDGQLWDSHLYRLDREAWKRTKENLRSILHVEEDLHSVSERKVQ